MSDSPDRVERASAWVYSGIWAGLARLFLVPRDPPSMPSGAHEIIGAFRPAPGYLRYTKLFFWIGLLGMDIALGAAWVAITIASPIAGALLLVPALVLIVAPDIVAYIAIHLRYDTTWYVLTDRSMRLRRGVMTLTETTITYENVQNVSIEQGPLQRFYGIADLVVQTAGGGSGGGGQGGKHGSADKGHAGRIEGVDNAREIRDLIMTKVRASRSAGLGDERARGVELLGAGGPGISGGGAWSPAHLAVLREIRNRLRPHH